MLAETQTMRSESYSLVLDIPGLYWPSRHDLITHEQREQIVPIAESKTQLCPTTHCRKVEHRQPAVLHVAIDMSACASGLFRKYI
jgi:hypothetical protein